MTTALERLQGLLDQKEAEIDKLNEKVEELHERINGRIGSWMYHRKAETDDRSLPIPRLEFEWTQKRGWADFEVEYRLVVRHLDGEIIQIPLGLTTSGSSTRQDPRTRSEDPAFALPFRDGAHSAHDGSLLGLPVYALMPGGPVLVDTSGWSAAVAKGLAARRPGKAAKR